LRAVLQRVISSRVEVDGTIVGQIEKGWLVLLGIGRGDTKKTAEYLADRCVKLRGFPDDAGKMNLSVVDVGASMLVVSQFTLYGDCARGRRPGFDRAAPPILANELYECFCDSIRQQGVPVQQGVFQADMKVTLVNDGPVTFLVEKEEADA
jgi:D-aminoacyl-tRNA deacylase